MTTLDDDQIRLGGTAGWEAPEVEARLGLTRRNLPRAYNYSYGLIIWSVLLHHGDTPAQTAVTSRQHIALQEVENSRDAIRSERYSVLHGEIRQCLGQEPANHPINLLWLFPNRMDLEKHLIAQCEGLSTSQSGEGMGDLELENLAKTYDPFRKPKYERWEPNRFASYYANELLSSISKLYVHGRGSYDKIILISSYILLVGIVVIAGEELCST